MRKHHAFAFARAGIQVERSRGAVMARVHAGRRVSAFLRSGRLRDRADERLEFGDRDHARAEQRRDVHQRQHGRFDADARGAAVERVVGERLGNVRGSRGRKFREAIGAGSGDRHTGGANQFQRQRVRRHAQPDGGQPGGDDVRDFGTLRHHQRQRTGPVAPREHVGGIGPLRRQGARHLDGIDVDDQRTGVRASLGGEDSRHGNRVQRVSSQAVDRLGGEGDEVSGADQPGGALYLRTHSGVSSLSSPAIFPVFRHTRYAWMNASRSPSRTRSTSPAERRLRRSFTIR